MRKSALARRLAAALVYRAEKAVREDRRRQTDSRNKGLGSGDKTTLEGVSWRHRDKKDRQG